jgi:hypothetical protein
MAFRHSFSFSRRGFFRASELKGASLEQGQGARCARRGAGSAPLEKIEGNGAPISASVFVVPHLLSEGAGASRRSTRLRLTLGRAYLAVSRRRLSPATPIPGPRFLGRGSERALPGFACPSPASFSQSGHDAARAETPEPPGSGVTTPARRLRTFSRSQSVSRERPSMEKVKWNISLELDFVKRPEVRFLLGVGHGIYRSRYRNGQCGHRQYLRDRHGLLP